MPTICMGDVLRFYNKLNELEDAKDYLLLTVVRYSQNSDETKKIKKIYEIKLYKQHIPILFRSLTVDDLREYDRHIKAITKVTPTVRNQYKAMLLELNRRSGLIKINPKVGSASRTRRVQCSIPKFEKKCADFVHEVYKGGSLRGIALTMVLPSPRRFRNKKSETKQRKTKQSKRKESETKQSEQKQSEQKQSETKHYFLRKRPNKSENKNGEKSKRKTQKKEIKLKTPQHFYFLRKRPNQLEAAASSFS